MPLSLVWRYYFSSVQRFFKHMIMSSKVLFVFPASHLQIPYCVEIAKKALEENNCVVIGLQSTGEAHIRQMMARQRSQTGESDESGESLMLVDGFISSPREILLQLMENAFPSIQIPDYLRIFAEKSGDDDDLREGKGAGGEEEGMVIERRRGGMS